MFFMIILIKEGGTTTTEEDLTPILQKWKDQIMKEIDTKLKPIKTKLNRCGLNNQQILYDFQQVRDKVNDLVSEMDLAKNENIQEEQNTDSEIRDMNMTLNQMSVLTKMIRVDSCDDLARNGIKTSGYYDLDLGNPQNPVTAWCTLPEGEIKLGKEVTVQVELCQTNKCFTKPLAYNASQDQLEKLVDSASSCYQDITFNCITSPLQVLL